MNLIDLSISWGYKHDDGMLHYWRVPIINFQSQWRQTLKADQYVKAINEYITSSYPWNREHLYIPNISNMKYMVNRLGFSEMIAYKQKARDQTA